LNKPKLNILVALPYCDRPFQELLSNSPDVRFLLDSGAFTSWKKGTEITLDQYCTFLDGMKIKPWRYFMLDKIGDPVTTKANLKELNRRGYKPIPVFTRGEALHELEEMYQVSDVVALGGLVGTPGNRGFVKGLQEVIRGRDSHWLGFVNHDFMSHFKPYSCDSSSWSAPLRFGGKLPLYIGNGLWKNVAKLDFSTRPKPWVWNAVEYMGEDPRALAFEKEWHNSGSGKNVLERLLYKGWVRYSMECEMRLGTKLFLAVASAAKRYTMSLIEAHQFWLNHPSYWVGSATPESLNASLRS
jgi:hypothetical protein